MTEVWHTAFNETDAALSRVQGLGIALRDLVENHFHTNDDACLALTALALTLNERIAAVMDLRSVEFSAGNDASCPAPAAA